MTQIGWRISGYAVDYWRSSGDAERTTEASELLGNLGNVGLDGFRGIADGVASRMLSKQAIG